MRLEHLQELTREVPVPAGKDQQQWLQERMRQLGLDPEALYQELEMTSPLVDTHRDISWSNAHLQLHSHTFYELLYCCNDCGAEYLVGERRYRLRQGDVIIVPPGVSHRPLLPEKMEVPYERYVLWFSKAFLDQYIRIGRQGADWDIRLELLRTGGTRWENIGRTFLAGVLEAEQRLDGWETAVVGNTVSLLTQIKRAADDRSARALEAERPELLDRILAHVEEHYREELTIGALADRFYVSPSTVSHLCKQKLGVSFHRLVTQRRLIGAKTLIDRGEPLEEVARQVGFRDYSGFYRAFRQEYGISPRQYRHR